MALACPGGEGGCHSGRVRGPGIPKRPSGSVRRQVGWEGGGCTARLGHVNRSVREHVYTLPPLTSARSLPSSFLRRLCTACSRERARLLRTISARSRGPPLRRSRAPRFLNLSPVKSTARTECRSHPRQMAVCLFPRRGEGPLAPAVELNKHGLQSRVAAARDVTRAM